MFKVRKVKFCFDDRRNSMSDLFKHEVVCPLFLASLSVDDSRLEDSSSLMLKPLL